MRQKDYLQPRIGVTGTNGKTSTILILKHILEGSGINPAVLDMWKGNQSYTLQEQQLKNNNADCLLAEIPAEAIRQNYLHGSYFDAVALTNLSLDHLKHCNTPDQYYLLKSRFFNEQQPQAKAIMNADDPRALSLAHDGALDFICYAIHYPHAMIVAENIHQFSDRQTFDITIKGEFASISGKLVSTDNETVTWTMTGEHNIYNALLATSLALLFDIELSKIAQLLSSFPGIRRNMEAITFENFTVIDDAAKNPAALLAALRAAEQIYPTHFNILHGMYGGGGQVINQCNARIFSTWLSKRENDRLFITRSMYHCKNKYQVSLHEEKAFLEELKNSKTDFSYYPDLPDAIDTIMAHSQKDELIILLGGPVLNRAGELLRLAGGMRDFSLVTPSTIAAIPPLTHAQYLSPNPT